MTWVALKSLSERRMRAALTALAIVLGVAMIAGSLILTDTIDRAFTNIFSSSYTQTDLVVRSTPVVSDSFAGAPTVPAELLTEIRQVPGVAVAGGTLTDLSGSGSAASAKLIGKDGKVIQNNMPTFGFGVDPAQPRFNPMQLASGSWAAGPDQVVLDVGTAQAHGFAIGDRVGVAAEGPVRTFTVTGLARFGGVDSLGGATIAVFDIPTARSVLGKTGFDAIQVAAAPGVSESALAARIAPLLPDGVDVATSAEQSARDKAGISQFITFIRGFLLVLRRDRAVRRRLRHLQHPVDDGRAAVARAGHAAHPRRLAAPGAALGDRRGRHHRPGRVAGRPRGRIRPRQGPDRPVRRHGAGHAAGPTVFASARSSSRCWWARGHPAGRRRPGDPRHARRARSTPSARARSRPAAASPGSPRSSLWPPSPSPAA